ncbi:SsgA family sporulation/cell division regulator [Streptomyces armeniacus]|uniref:SsgA family sporulation/cell division regulator n=1 Tax=Streptomyces armeniacus TaxID=83291 RepID=A0A345XXU6_9ACTN|nr:SsgA family sporulation/cell division regulator [Streptomyces armeniacus]AXK36462.1 SsgA family sporulation/cell division regulator [Streptomyces armeniacus]
MSGVIQQNAQARLIARASAARPLSAVLRYDEGDPLAVRIVFPPDASLDGAEVTWVFSRELLDEGTDSPTGEGDVQLWPCGPAHTMLELHTAEGMALIELRSSDVRRFLRSCYAAVPRGREQAAAGLDTGLSDLLRGV